MRITSKDSDYESLGVPCIRGFGSLRFLQNYDQFKYESLVVHVKKCILYELIYESIQPF